MNHWEGKKMVTIKEVAADAGVSVGTVSKVLNNMYVKADNRRRVEESIHKLGYQVNTYARGLKAQQTFTVAIIVPDLINPFFALLVNYVEQVLAAIGYKLLVCNSHCNADRELAYINMAKQNKVDGLIAVTYSNTDEYLEADMDVRAEPDKFYDRVIVINLSELEPHINGPFTPDAATPISEFAAKVKANGYPRKMEVGLIGSCTNSSYQDLSRAASIARQAYEDKIPVAAPLIINPGSEQIRYTAERDGIIGDFERIGATIMANACGPCIGQWKRHTDDNTRKNSIVTSFNRNFAKRADGNPNTHAFVASPELTLALTIAGDLCFNPLTDTLKTEDGKVVKLKEPKGSDFPPKGFEVKDNGYLAPTGKNVVVNIDPESNRLQALKPFAPWNGEDFTDMPLLIKAEGKCTTDHISMAGPWLRFRGHLENISDNMLMGAVNAFNGKTNSVLNQLNNEYEAVSAVAKQYKANSISSIVVAEENYGEGSSREHAAMEPRFLNVKVILAKSFARIHETNLKKQGMLALTFANKEDYSKIRENDHISIIGLKDFQPGKPLTAVLLHADGTQESFPVNHTYNDLQIKWFKAGSALNTAH